MMNWKKSKLIGSTAFIKDNIESIHAGGWGKIVAFDGTEYHIAMYEDESDCCVFTRNEFVIRRERKNKQ